MSEDKSLKEKIFGKGREDYEVAADKAQDLGGRAHDKADEAQHLAQNKVNKTAHRAGEVEDDANRKIEELRRQGNAAAEKGNAVRHGAEGHRECSGEQMRSK